METWAIAKDDDVLCHYGVKGMKWNKHLFGKKPDPMYGTAYKLRGGPVIDQKRAMGGTALVNNQARLRRQGGVGAEAELAIKNSKSNPSLSSSQKRRRGAAQSAANNEMAKAFEIRKKKDLKTTKQREVADRKAYSDRRKAENEAEKAGARLSKTKRGDYAAGTITRDGKAFTRVVPTSSGPKTRQARSAKAQAETIKAGQQQVRSMIQKVRKNARLAKSSSAAAKTQKQHVENMINKFSKTKAAWGYVDYGASGAKYGIQVTNRKK